MKFPDLVQPALGFILLALITAFGCSVVAAEKNGAKANNMQRAQPQPPAATGVQKWAKYTSVSLRCTREDNSVYKWCTTIFYGRMPGHCELIRTGCN